MRAITTHASTMEHRRPGPLRPKWQHKLNPDNPIVLLH
jgi:hypothetical protein